MLRYVLPTDTYVTMHACPALPASNLYYLRPTQATLYVNDMHVTQPAQTRTCTTFTYKILCLLRELINFGIRLGPPLIEYHSHYE